ncbi:MAG: hypothetical protein HQL46_15980 [Gammaproteobacteria bacterium]|nr:hypothetical protein [Gammaproteobacteria bacterium]
MALAKEDIEQIQELIEQSWANKNQASNDNIHYEIEIRERIVRVEEELKNQRQLILDGFKQSDKRFEELQHNMDKRFEQSDKLLAQMQHNMDKRFEQSDKLLAQVQQNMDKRFEQVDKRFEQMDKQFTEMGKRMDRFMFWSLGITISVGVFVINYLK